MRKNFLAIIFVSLLFTSCGGNDNSSSKSNSSSSSSAETLVSYPEIPYNNEDIWNILSTIAKDGNYTLEYEYENRIFVEYYTEYYSYYSMSNTGYVALPDYNNSNEKLFYMYELESNNQIVVGNALSLWDKENNKGVPIRSRQNTDYMYLFVSGDASCTKEDIISNQQEYFTRNVDMITILAYTLGYGGFESLIDAVTFKLEEDNLTFKFYPNFKEGYEVIDGVTGTFKNIGTTSYPILDNFVNTYQFPEKTITEEMAQVFKQEVLSSDIKITRVWNMRPADELEDKKVDITRDKAYIETYYGNDYYPKLKYPVTSLYAKEEDGRASLNYINPNNELTSIDTGKTFDSMFPSISDYFEPLSFRANENENVYHYIGYNARRLTQVLALYDLGVTESIDITVNNGKITKIVSKTPVYYDSYGNRFYTQAVVELKETRAIPSIEVLIPTSNDTQIQNVLSLFDGSTSFNAHIVTGGLSQYATNVTVADDIILYEHNEHDTDEGASGELVKHYNGYQQVPEGLVPFTIETIEDEQWQVIGGVAKASDNTINGATIKDAIGFNAVSTVFEKNNYGQIVTRKAVGDIGNFVFSGELGYCMVPSSFRMELDADGKPLKITYNAMLDEGFYLNEEEITFSNWGTAILPEIFDFTSIGIWNAPTTWKETISARDYEEIVGLFNEEYIEQIPYLYDRRIAGDWFVNNTSAFVNYFHFCNINYLLEKDYYKNYAEAYIAMLLDLGFVKNRDNAWGLEAYTKGNLNIRVYYDDIGVDLFIFDVLV